MEDYSVTSLLAVNGIPDLPDGWTRGGPLGLLVLVVLIFLFFLSLFLRANWKRENEREASLARLQNDHAERIKALADSLSVQHQATMERQLEHCKEEVQATVSGYLGQVAILDRQNQSLVALVDRKLAEAACRYPQHCGTGQLVTGRGVSGQTLPQDDVAQV